jgi:hypothetical protein
LQQAVPGLHKLRSQEFAGESNAGRANLTSRTDYGTSTTIGETLPSSTPKDKSCHPWPVTHEAKSCSEHTLAPLSHPTRAGFQHSRPSAAARGSLCRAARRAMNLVASKTRHGCIVPVTALDYVASTSHAHGTGFLSPCVEMRCHRLSRQHPPPSGICHTPKLWIPWDA